MEDPKLETVIESGYEDFSYNNFRKKVANSRAVGSWMLEELKNNCRQYGFDTKYPKYCERLIEEYPKYKEDFYKRNHLPTPLPDCPTRRETRCNCKRGPNGELICNCELRKLIDENPQYKEDIYKLIHERSNIQRGDPEVPKVVIMPKSDPGKLIPMLYFFSGFLSGMGYIVSLLV